jgi:hypothetical protein
MAVAHWGAGPDCFAGVVLFPINLFRFPNNWKIDGDYPPAGGQCNSFLEEIHRETQRRGERREPQIWFNRELMGITFLRDSLRPLHCNS